MSKFQLKKCFFPGRETGASLLSTMMGLAAMGLFISMTQGAWVKVNQTSKVAGAAMGFDEVEKIFMSEYNKTIKRKAAGSCFTPQNFNVFLNSNMGKLETEVSTEVVKDEHPLVLRAVSRNTKVRAAVERCKNQTKISNANNSNQNVMRFCLRTNRDPNAVKNSFLASEGTFTEVSIFFKDNVTANNLSCNQFLNAISGGAQIFYTFYWTVDLGGKLRYRSHNGFYQVSRGG